LKKYKFIKLKQIFEDGKIIKRTRQGCNQNASSASYLYLAGHKSSLLLYRNMKSRAVQ